MYKTVYIFSVIFLAVVAGSFAHYSGMYGRQSKLEICYTEVVSILK